MMAEENGDKVDNNDPTKPEAGKFDQNKDGVKKEKKSKKEKEVKITEKDFKKVEGILKQELAKRKASQFRQKHEAKWSKVDDQIALIAPDYESESLEEDWLNCFELGNLAVASEIMTADLLRVIFPDQRNWFEAHIEPPMNLDPTTGEQVPLPKKLQQQLDGRLRAFMTQQHVTFGLRDRVELSLKEALHHGAFVAEVDEAVLSMYLTGNRVKDIAAPTWIPHSMWNCWPDPSPSLVGSAMFYTGSMYVRSYMPLHKLVEMSLDGEGWIKGAIKKVPREEHTVNENVTKDVEIITYWGDVTIPSSSDGMNVSVDDLYFPNYKAILANGKLVYLNENKTPYPPIIYKGYERMDVRDPYAHSPIIKQSPMQGITSILANEYVNGVQLAARPPITYDGNDPEFIENGGPTISPGAKTATKGSSAFNQLKIGDPATALAGVQFGIENMKNALGRPGIEVGARATKAEVDTKQADSEAGPFGFAIKVDDALRTFLYMQHAMNQSHKDLDFSFYDADIDSPDFIRIKHKDLPDTVHFEVVGTKGILGEAKRQMAFSNVSGFMLGHPAMAEKVDIDETMKQMYQDAGVKSPERFIKQTDGIPLAVKQKMQQDAQMIQKLQIQLKDSETQNQVKLNGQQLNHEAKMTKIQSDHANAIAEIHLKADQLESSHKIALGAQAHDLKLAQLDKVIDKFHHVVKLTSEKHKAKEAILASKGAMGIDTEDNKGDNTSSTESEGTE